MRPERRHVPNEVETSDPAHTMHDKANSISLASKDERLMSDRADRQSTFEGNGAEILVESLHRAGVGTIFGLSGDTGVVFYEALYRGRDRIRHVMTRDERSAAFMADVYARCTNGVGVVEVSSGGGADFVVSGLGESFASSVPVLVISSDINSGSRDTGALTEIDQSLLFSAVTKWRATVASADRIPGLVAEALAAATTGRPGPVCLTVPEEVFEERTRVAIPGASTTVPRERPAAAEASVRGAAEALRKASRPAIVVGSGVHLSGAWTELAELAETAGIPVATTIHGKGTFPEGNPLSLGVIGANGAREYGNEYLTEADAVLFVGTRANATDTNGWTSPSRSGATIIAQNDVDSERAGRNFPGSIALAGDARTVLGQLKEALDQYRNRVREQRLGSWIAEKREAWDRSTRGKRLPEGGGLLDPREVVRAIHRAAGADAVIVADAGTPTPNVAAYWEVETAARSVIVPRGHGPMGYAVPGAIGAAVAFPGRSIVALTTDGSFGMCCGELETASRLGLPIVYVHFQNGSMGWIKMLQHLYVNEHYFGVEMREIDTVAVARAMGVDATRATDLRQFSDALGRGLGSRGPTLVDVPVPEHIDLAPPVAPWQAALAGEAERPVY